MGLSLASPLADVLSNAKLPNFTENTKFFLSDVEGASSIVTLSSMCSESSRQYLFVWFFYHGFASVFRMLIQIEVKAKLSCCQRSSLIERKFTFCCVKVNLLMLNLLQSIHRQCVLSIFFVLDAVLIVTFRLSLSILFSSSDKSSVSWSGSFTILWIAKINTMSFNLLSIRCGIFKI